MSKKETKQEQQKRQMIGVIVMSMAVLISLAAILIGAISSNTVNSGSHDHDHDHENNQSQIISKEIKLGIDVRESDIHYASALQFKSEVESATDGIIKVTICDTPGLDKQAVNNFGTNTADVDIIITGVENFVGVDERMDATTLPFIFSGHEDAAAFLEGDAQESIEKDLLQKNIRVLAHYSDGFEYITTASSPIINAMDLSGKRFAVVGDSPMKSFLSLFRASTVEVKSEDLAQTLQGPTIDGYVGKLDDIVNKGLSRYQKTVAVTYHRYHALAFAVSESFWQTLSESQQRVIRAAAENSAMSDRKNIQQSESKMLDALKNAGVRVTHPSVESFAKEAESKIMSYSSKYGSIIQSIVANMHQNN